MSSIQPTFTLPDLLTMCPFPAAISPHRKSALESSAWIDKFHVFPDAKRMHFVKSCNERLISHCYPYAGREEFRLCCDFVNLLFVLDEISDEQDPEDVQALKEVFVKALRDDLYDDSAVSRMTKEFKQLLLSKMSAYSMRRFVKYCVTYIEAVGEEAALRKRGEVLGLDAYKTLRRENAAIQPCFGLIEAVLDINLPDEVFEDEVFIRLFWGACDMVCWANDLYSYNIEQATGQGGNNYVTVLMEKEGYSLQQASDYVGEVFKTLVEQFVQDKQRLPSWSTEIDADVQAYISALEYWVIGNINWSFESQRYFGPEHEEVKRTRTVALRQRRN